MSVTESNWQEIVVSTPGICGGKPRIAGTRITIDIILDNLAIDLSWDEIIAEYPQITKDDIRAVLEYVTYTQANSRIERLRLYLNDYEKLKMVNYDSDDQKVRYIHSPQYPRISNDMLLRRFSKIISPKNINHKLDKVLDLVTQDIEIRDFITLVLFLYYCAGEETVAQNTLGIRIKQHYENSGQYLKQLGKFQKELFFVSEDNKFRLTEEGLTYGTFMGYKFLNHIR